MNRQDDPSPPADLGLYLRKETLRFLEEHIQRTYKDLESLDSKARANIGAASLFLSFVTSFQLVAFGTTTSVPYFLLLILALLLYAAMIVTSLVVILSVEYYWPVAAQWDVITYYWDFETEKDYVEQIISDTLAAIDLNQAAIDKKARFFRISGVMFGLIIVDLVVMTAFRLAG
jgi:hypothetical protein